MHPNACTDTRKIIENCIYFALKGENFNGNDYAEEALEKGARYAVIDDNEYTGLENTIYVDSVLETLQELAAFHRNHCNAKVIGLTGSNGKTTTKELINSVLSKKYKTIATKGNLNNHIGVPLTLLSIKVETEVAVIEMGANHPKEIDFLCTLAQPDFGYITNFGKAHLEGFGSIKGVIEAKSELYEYLINNDKSVFLNADDPNQLKKLGHYIKKYGYSKDKKEFFKIGLTSADPFVTINVEDININTNLIGSYNFTNCCAAIVIGKYFNIGLKDIKDALENYVPENNRSQIIDKNGNQIILDAYNANPSSMEVALENFSKLSKEPKFAFLGDMFELGKTAEIEHQNIADLANEIRLKNVFLIGENFNKTKTDYKKFNEFKDIEAFLSKEKLPANASILIKGSRGMALERLLELL